jgi:hypothetical protein
LFVAPFFSGLEAEEAVVVDEEAVGGRSGKEAAVEVVVGRVGRGGVWQFF